MKKNVNLGYAERTVTLDLLQDKLLAVTGNGVEAASLDDFVAAVGNVEEAMRRIAWGIPLRQTANTHWGTVGNWPLWEEYRRHVGRYLVTPDGEARKLNPSHSGYYVDGSEVDESEGNVMVIAPKLHVRVMDDALEGCPVVWMSQQPLGGFAFANAGGEWNCYAAYKGAMSGSKLVSKSSTATTTTSTIANKWTAAQANGSDWGLFDYDGWRWYCLMCLCESDGNPNIQETLGYGVCGSSNGAVATDLLVGATKAMGDETGAIPLSIDSNPDRSRVSVCGIEDLYGWINEAMQGIYFGSSANAGQNQADAYIYKGNRLPSSAELTTHPNGEYRTTTRPVGSGYIKTLSIGDLFDPFPTSLSGGSSTTYWCDHCTSVATGQLPLVGNASNKGQWCGPFSLYLTDNYGSYGSSSRLGYYGHLTFA